MWCECCEHCGAPCVCSPVSPCRAVCYSKCLWTGEEERRGEALGCRKQRFLLLLFLLDYLVQGPTFICKLPLSLFRSLFLLSLSCCCLALSPPLLSYLPLSISSSVLGVILSSSFCTVFHFWAPHPDVGVCKHWARTTRSVCTFVLFFCCHQTNIKNSERKKKHPLLSGLLLFSFLFSTFFFSISDCFGRTVFRKSQ